MAKFPTAARVLNHARPRTIAPFKDHDLIANCEKCDLETRLSECRQEDTETAKNYRCSGCDEILAITRLPPSDDIVVPDSGYRLDRWIFANAVDVRIEGIPMLRFPAMRNATTYEVRVEHARKVDKTRREK